MRGAAFFLVPAGSLPCAAATDALQRLHQVDDRRGARGLGRDDLGAVELRLEQLPQRLAVLALELLGIERRLRATR